MPLEDIRLGTNARKDWDRLEDSFRPFIESVQEQGFLEPLLVREVGSGPGAWGASSCSSPATAVTRRPAT